MKFIFSILVVFVLGLGVLTACQDTAPPLTAGNASDTANVTNVNSAPKTDEHDQVDDAPRISLADAKKAFDEGNAVFVDTRAEASYVNEHIKGAINVPAADFEAKYKEIPTDKKIIAYCS